MHVNDTEDPFTKQIGNVSSTAALSQANVWQFWQCVLYKLGERSSLFDRVSLARFCQIPMESNTSTALLPHKQHQMLNPDRPAFGIGESSQRWSQRASR